MFVQGALGVFSINKWRWRRRIRGLKAAVEDGRIRQRTLRLVLGTGRSGTSWLSQVLAASETPLRFFKEPLNRSKPQLKLTGPFDRTASPYQSELSESDVLPWAYRSLTEEGDRQWKTGQVCEPLRGDKDWEVCLVKEVHALLASEALIKALKCPTVVITRDPIYVVDSHLSFRGLKAPLWRNEFEYLGDTVFLERYFGDHTERIEEHRRRIPDCDQRLRVVLEKTLAVAVLNRMLRILGEENELVHHIRYEELCQDPELEFRKAAIHLGIAAGDEMMELIKATRKSNHDDDPYSIYRDTANQTNRPLKYLDEGECSKVRIMLDECGLGT